MGTVVFVGAGRRRGYSRDSRLWTLFFSLDMLRPLRGQKAAVLPKSVGSGVSAAWGDGGCIRVSKSRRREARHNLGLFSGLLFSSWRRRAESEGEIYSTRRIEASLEGTALSLHHHGNFLGTFLMCLHSSLRLASALLAVHYCLVLKRNRTAARD